MSIPGPSTVEVPVLIVGAGPAWAGPFRRLVAVRGGASSRRAAPGHRPHAAHIINQRTVEILRHLGISDRFHAVATPQHLMASNLWVTTLAGLEVARSETWGTSAERARPDRHVAWRSIRYTPDSARQLPAGVERALGLPGRQA